MTRVTGVLNHHKEVVIDRLAPEAEPVIAPSTSPLTRDFLAWIASAPRSYGEAMEAWRSSCPRFTIWEDALADDLIHIDRDGNLRLSDRTVLLTPHGRALLDRLSNTQSIRMSTKGNDQ